MSLTDRSAAELLRDLNARKVSSVELTKAYLDQIQKHDGEIKAFLLVDPDAALARAKEIDDRRAAGKPVGKLGGLPVAIKDVICTQGVKTTCASKMLRELRAAVRRHGRQEAEGGRCGADRQDEHGRVRDGRLDRELRVLQDGQSVGHQRACRAARSGGAAACLAAGMAPLSIGTDTGGSIRQPAAFCGVTGLKPTYGRVSRYGLVAFASSLDQIGPLGHSAEDCALLLEVLAGHDPLDSTSANLPAPEYAKSVNQPLQGLKLGLVREHFGAGLDGEIEAAVREAVKVYESLGATVKDVSMPHSKYGIATYYIIAPSEASSNLARYDGVHYGYRTDEKQMLAELADEQKRYEAEKNAEEAGRPRYAADSPVSQDAGRRLWPGSEAPHHARHVRAQRRLLRRLLPEGPQGPPADPRRLRRGVRGSRFHRRPDDALAGRSSSAKRPTIRSSMYLEDLYTVTTNLAGIGGISIPCGFTKAGLPIGLQLQCRPFDEERLLRAAAMFQQATDWHTKRPNWLT